MALNDTSSTSTAAQVVVGLFSNGSDAERAIRELREANFRSSQIGAAFRDSSYSSSGSSTPSPLGSSVGSTTSTAADYGTSTTSRAADRVSEAGHSAAAHAENWWERLKHAFSDDETDTSSGSYSTTDLPEAQRRSGEEPFASKISTDATTTGTSYTTPTSSTGTDAGLYAAGQPGANDYDYDYSGEDFGGSLSSLGVPADRARSLSAELGSGGAIVTVRDPSRSEEAERILENAGGRIRHEAVGSASTGSNTGDLGTANQRIQLFGEVLRVHKDRIRRGEVRLRKEVITENQTIQVPVTREEIVIERTAVSGTQPATGATFNENQEIRVPLTEEVASVDKVPYVREEVQVGKRAVTEERSVDDTVRREELRVEDQTKGPESTRTDLDRKTGAA